MAFLNWKLCYQHYFVTTNWRWVFTAPFWWPRTVLFASLCRAPADTWVHNIWTRWLIRIWKSLYQQCLEPYTRSVLLWPRPLGPWYVHKTFNVFYGLTEHNGHDYGQNKIYFQADGSHVGPQARTIQWALPEFLTHINHQRERCCFMSFNFKTIFDMAKDYWNRQ